MRGHLAGLREGSQVTTVNVPVSPGQTLGDQMTWESFSHSYTHGGTGSGKTFATAVVIIPPEEVWLPIQTLRQQYDPHVRRWMPHITLLYPFRRKDEFDPLEARLAWVCGCLQPFDVTLTTVNVFAHARASHTIWLAPEPKERVAALHAALWQVVPNCDDVRRHPEGFTPHVTIGQVRGEERLGKLLAALHTTWQPVAFTVSHISLIWRNDPPDDVFRVGKRLDLGQR